ncbi:hypothetical protein Q3G72_008106 [Acer saccharum]|nr:hypothetical protein Q3G72_008106 [Acer saccharum]
MYRTANPWMNTPNKENSEVKNYSCPLKQLNSGTLNACNNNKTFDFTAEIWWKHSRQGQARNRLRSDASKLNLNMRILEKGGWHVPV